MCKIGRLATAFAAGQGRARKGSFLFHSSRLSWPSRSGLKRSLRTAPVLRTPSWRLERMRK